MTVHYCEPVPSPSGLLLLFEGGLEPQAAPLQGQLAHAVLLLANHDDGGGAVSAATGRMRLLSGPLSVAAVMCNACSSTSAALVLPPCLQASSCLQIGLVGDGPAWALAPKPAVTAFLSWPLVRQRLSAW